MKKMLMLCTHGRFGEELIRSAEMITGPLKNVQAFSLMPGMDPFDYAHMLEKWIDKHPDAQFLCLADLFGGTPSNMLSSLIRKKHIEVVTGLNLAMLIECCSQLEVLEMPQLKECALTSLRNSGFDVNVQYAEILKEKEG